MTAATMAAIGSSMRLADLLGLHRDRARQAGEQVATANLDVDLLEQRPRAADLELDLLGGALADQHVVDALHVADDRLVELVAGDADRLGAHDAAERDDRDLGRAATDVDDHRAGRLLDRQSRADRCRHRLLDEERLTRARLHRRLEHRALLDLGDAGGHAHDHARLGLPGEALHARLVDEVAKHRLGDLEVGDDAVLQGPDGHDAAGRAPEHALGVDAHGEHALGVSLDGDDRGLDQHDAAAAHRDQRVGGTEVDGHVAAPGVEEHIYERQVAGSFRLLRTTRRPRKWPHAKTDPRPPWSGSVVQRRKCSTARQSRLHRSPGCVRTTSSPGRAGSRAPRRPR